MLQLGIEAVERGLVPDGITRWAIRGLCERHLHSTLGTAILPTGPSVEAFIASLRDEPIAPLPHKANEQHYELPPEFFATVLGPRRKYSCCLWQDNGTTLDEAEEAALEETCRRAEIADGQQILELGCGWGSLCLWLAERYPHANITAISNSAPQRHYIESVAAARKLSNLKVYTVDMNAFPTAMEEQSHGPFDRIVSVEMFEHMRNYERLLASIAPYLKPDGKLFVHLFCHRSLAYPFQSEGPTNWMGRYFFSGGMMPSADLLRRFDRDLKVTRHWSWDGRHYQRTAEAWLENLDDRRSDVIPILQSAYGHDDGRRWLHRWRMFFLAVAELFGYSQGEEWFVSHYLLEHAR